MTTDDAHHELPQDKPAEGEKCVNSGDAGLEGKRIDGTERLVDRFPAWIEACKAAGVVIPESTPRGKVA